MEESDTNSNNSNKGLTDTSSSKTKKMKKWLNKDFTVTRLIGILIVTGFVIAIIAVGLIAGLTGKGDSTTDSGSAPTSAPGSQTTASPMPDLTIRLPTAIEPVAYDVRLQPTIGGDFVINGSVVIQMVVIEETSRIVLHMADIITANDTIQLNQGTLDGTEIEIVSHTYMPEFEYYVATLSAPLEVGQNYYLSMDFQGYLNDQLRGFYRSVYSDENDNDVYLATTQFQPTDARRAFPCFDEPAMKATFSISLARTEGMVAVSNMPLVESTLSEDEVYTWDRFQESVTMSTYLVAFVISDFVKINDTTANGIEFSIYARSEMIDLGYDSLELGSNVLTYFEDYFAIPYPLPKQDMFAIPDFSAGAMENWGLITYREAYLLYDPQISTVSNKEFIGEVIVHELAHQWFGNLVTPYWWIDLWLNEGFATYMSYVGLDPFQPTWRILEQFVYREMHPVMNVDALPTSHPMSVPVSTPDEINEIFDAISYNKGACVIRMMRHFLTEATFKAALTNYLNANEYSAATQDDLWGFLTTQAHADGSLEETMTVKEIMDTWTLQMGYPVVTATRSTTSSTVVNISQERFLLVESTPQEDDPDYIWMIPLTYTTQTEQDFTNTNLMLWLGNEPISISNFPANDWFIFNIQEVGYYRVNYDQENWNRIITQLTSDHTIIRIENRAQIMDDTLNLARAGLLSYNTALDATFYLTAEQEYVPWASALYNLGYLESMFSGGADYDAMTTFILDMLTPVYTFIGFEDDVTGDHLEQKLRVSLTSWACGLDYQECLDDAIATFATWVASSGSATAVSPNLKSTVYCTGIAQGTTADWEFAWNVAQTTDLASERDLLLSALGCSTNETTLEMYLDMAFTDGSGIRKQDISRVFSSVASNDVGQAIAWTYTQQNFEAMALYSGSFNAAGSYVYTVTYEFNTQEQLDEVLAFYEQYESVIGTATLSIEQAIERVTANIAWMESNYNTILQWLQEKYPATTVDIRLPDALIPSHYDVQLRPFIGGNFSVDGYVKVDFAVAQATPLVVLHMADIITYNDTIKLTRLSDNAEVSIVKHSYDPEFQYYIAEVEEDLPVGETYSIEMNFEGYLNDQLKGFYRSVYQDENGNDVYLAMTQFGPTDARRAFPCFDEPHLKATFSITLGRTNDMTAVSNMPLLSSMADGEFTWDQFDTSVEMSTYLVAFIISDFEASSTTITGDTTITFSVMARAEAIPETAYALSVGPPILEYFEEYFAIPYPLAKMDMAAVPDFAAGAMENWGLVTYRETALLYNEALSTASNKQRVGVVIAHELAHQWFGNLVTPAWWNDIWLNEGFASYHEFLGIDAVEPSWAMLDQFVTDTMYSVLRADSLLTSHPVNMQVETTEEITALFDLISYNKGASLLRMLSHFLTDDTFKTGLTNYLNENAYQAATQDDLWAALETQATVDNVTLPASLAAIMNPWTLQMGYPYVTITRSYQDDTVTVTQKRFLRDGSDGPEPYMWYVPLSYTTETSPDFADTSAKEWLSVTEETKEISGIPAGNNWVIFNVQETGYFRVNYDNDNWQGLIQQLEADHTVIHTINRAQLLDDSLNLARADIVPYTTALSLSSYLTQEVDYVPWMAALGGLSYLESMMTRTSGYGYLKTFILDIMTPVYGSVGFGDSVTDPHLTQLLRSSIASWMCQLEDETCINSAQQEFANWYTAGSTDDTVSPNMKYTTYCTGIAQGGEAEWNFAWERYEQTSLATEKTLLLQAMGCSREIWILNRYLEWAFTDGSGIRKQDASTVFASVSGNDIGRDLAWSYLVDNWDHIVVYSDAFTTLSSLISSATAEFNTESELQELRNFQAANSGNLGTAEMTVEQAIESTEANIAWLETNYNEILIFLGGMLSTTEEITTTQDTATTQETNTTEENTTTDSTEEPLGFRIPGSLNPIRYEVEIIPFLEVGDFSTEGFVRIELEAQEVTSRIVLHMADIVTDNTTISLREDSVDGREILFSSHQYDPDLEYYIGNLEEDLEVNRTYFFSTFFEGYLNEQLRGFYRSVYTTSTGEDRYIGTTQFQPTSARRAFPCLDEPHLKAVFSISIAKATGMNVVSNMPSASSSDPVTGQTDMTWERFDDTEKMSTYLVAFVVSDFVYIEDTGPNNVLFRVYAREEGLADAQFALETGVDVLAFFEGYFNIPYPLPKQDMFAIPDFAAGAMENWGLITYRESALLYNADRSTAANKQRVGIIIAHELSHQWFGNLVTPAWWNDLWLNEGFASYMEYRGLDPSVPDWDIMDQFVSIDLHYVMGVDALTSSHPISISVSTPDEINEIFDSISYSKGASIIRMMEYYLTEDTFKQAVTNYLNATSYDVATQDDLWGFLTIQAHADGNLNSTLTVQEIMDTWTLQMGYPVVTVTRNANDNSILYAEQSRFVLIPGSITTPEENYLWWVPLTFMSSVDNNPQNTVPSYWLSPDSPQTEVVLPSALAQDEWVICNVQETGYYRVNYEASNWALLVQQLDEDHTVINQLNRAQLLDDSLNLARASLLSYDTALSLHAYLASEENYVPWSSAIRNLEYLESMFSREIDYELLKEYLVEIVVPAYERIGFADNVTNPHLEQLLRSSIVTLACHLDHADCVDNAVQQFADWVTNNGDETFVSPNVKSTVYCHGIAQGTTEDWDFAWGVAQSTNLATERDTLLTALGCSTDPAKLQDYLDMAFTANSGIRSQDSDRVFSAVAATDAGRDIAWAYLQQNFLEMAAYAGSFTTVGEYVEVATFEFNTQAQLAELEAFKTQYANDLGTAERSVDQAIERTQANINWMADNYQPIVNWLFNRYPSFGLNIRLPDSLIPVNYELRLLPDTEVNYDIEGSVIIEMNVASSTSRVVLHIKDIDTGNNDTIRLNKDTADGTEVAFVGHHYLLDLEYYVGVLESKLEVGATYFLHMDYTAALTDTLVGFYRSTYVNEQGETITVAATKFQPTDARKAFPSFDEPALKATYKTYLGHTPQLSALSNSPLVNTETIDGVVWDEFELSVRMSTYLVAFMITDFSSSSQTMQGMVNNAEVTVWARPEFISQAGFTLETAVDALEFFEGYFGVPFPLPKQDNIALPDFDSGAMENWGLIGYRETYMLYNEPTSTAAQKQQVAQVVVHEHAHMWFGNLVTPYWWTDLWLNEGFASYMEYVGLNDLQPTWSVLDMFVYVDMHSVMVTDSLMSSHPISVEVNHPDEINEIFDSISYNKGAAIIRMMEHSLTESTFTQALTSYLTEKQFDVATQDDLWGFLTIQAHADGNLDSNLTVKQIMDTWTLQMGYPVVTVTRSADGFTATVQQSRFTQTDEMFTTDQDYKWWIPVTYTTQVNPNFDDTFPEFWMSDSGIDESVNGLPDSTQWVLFNIGETAYYRVNYDDNNWNLLRDQLFADPTVIDTSNRAQIMDDAMNFARRGLRPYPDVLELSRYLLNETHFAPWGSSLRTFGYLESMLSWSPCYAPMQTFLLDLMDSVYSTVTFTDSVADEHLTQRLRQLIIDWACDLDQTDCVSQATTLFGQWKDANAGGNLISPNVKSTTFCTGIRIGNDDDWNFAWDQYLATEFADEQEMLLYALGCSTNTTTLQDFLDRTFVATDSQVRKQDSWKVFRAVATNNAGRDLAWDYLRDNWELFGTYYGSYITPTERLLVDVTSEFNSQQQLDELEAFRTLVEDTLGSATQSMDQAIERTENNIYWMEDYYDLITEWLQEQTSITC